MSSSGSGSRRHSSSQNSVRYTPPPPPPQPLDDNNRRNVDGRVIHAGRAVQLPEHHQAVFNEQLDRFGWQQIPFFFTMPVCVPLVREFYARLFFYFENDDQSRPAIISRVAGQEIILNRTYLSFLLGIPDDGECIYFKKRVSDFKKAIFGVDQFFYFHCFLKPNYTGGQIGERHVQDIFRDLNTFLEYNILPKSGTNNSVSTFQGFLLYCFSVNRKINLSYIIIMYIKNIIDNELMGLGYGALLSHIFSVLGIPVHNWDNAPPRMPISQRTHNLRNSHHFYEDPIPEHQPEPEQDAEPENEAEPEQDAYSHLGPDLNFDMSQNRWSL